MRSGSQAALDRARDRWGAVLETVPETEIDAAESIFSVADLLVSHSHLVAALEDNARDPEDRAQLAHDLFDGKVRGDVVELLMGLARERWSESGDLTLALEHLGVHTLLAGARRSGQLSGVEEELYVAMRTLRNERGLRLTLSDSIYEPLARAGLARNVFDSYNVFTKELLARAVVRTERGRTLAQSLTAYLDLAAELDNHIVASVTSAIPLTREQEERLSAILTRTYKTDVTIHVSIDPAVIGGIRIHVGDDVIDGTLASRITALRETFTN
ncbi:F0F1 ATP synthase subunit delta [Arcanobacterium haemolyticum]|uniref:F0F1 ATP synthase subunit delta n=1 Tax=Arcanobacterium haemolyticum TaxID=28264 RepID=UPI000D8AB0FE|nr:F0F1 ATP synthase subunit delta [Arcanobacterium haemolyticum]SPT75005.1 F-type ATPase subunit delta [Arcanobacterium haemolyticum]